MKTIISGTLLFALVSCTGIGEKCKLPSDSIPSVDTLKIDSVKVATVDTVKAVVDTLKKK